MKIFLLFGILSSAPVFANLLDHIAYTSEGIQAECSDYLGKVSSAGDIVLRDFLIHDLQGLSGCSLNAQGKVIFKSGSVEKREDLSCISARKLEAQHLAYKSHRRLHPDYQSLSREMLHLSRQLEAGIINARTLMIDTTLIQTTGVITISGHAGELVVLQSSELHPVISGVGVQLVGDIRPENILWHFPVARTLTLNFSGVDTLTFGEHLGMPGTFLAPHAEVKFNNALITGALFARKITGLADRHDCSGLVAGQINPAPLRLPNPSQQQRQRGKN